MTSQTLARPVPRLSPKLVWVAGRTALCLIALAALREPILDVVERTIGIAGVTAFVIGVASTPWTRLLIVAAAVACFVVMLWAGEKIGGLRGYVVALGAACATTLVAAHLLAADLVHSLVVPLILALNWAPMSLLERVGLNQARLNRLILVPPGLTEGLFAGRYLTWIGATLRGVEPAHPERPMKLPGALWAGLALALVCPSARLVGFERRMRSGPEVRIIALGDFNGLAYDSARHRLFVTGHGLEAVRSYDALDPASRPLSASRESGGAQGLELDAARGEVYAFSSRDGGVQVFDAVTLALRQVIPAPDMSPGDAWIAHEAATDRLIVASEADQRRGHPLVVLDRRTQAVVDDRAEEAGNLLVRPNAPILYMSFFRRERGVAAYDLEKKSIVARARTAGRMDRMAWDPRHRELLVAAPAEGRIHRFDPDTLEPRGTFAGIFAVRAIAIDEPNDCMLLASLASGKLALMGIGDRAVRRSWYLGPWLRSIAIAPGRGVAYVSGRTALYEVRYLPGT